jgi:tight adherence protein B
VMLASVALILMLIGAAIFATELVRRRRERLAVENRVNVIAMARLQRQTEAPDAFGGLLKAGTKKFDVFARRIFAVGIKRTWAMRSGALTLLLAASTSAGGIWILAYGFFGISALLSILASLLTLFFVPRFILSREQRRAERKFTDAFPDALDTVARMIRAGLPITAAMQTVAVESTPPVSEVFAAVADQVKIGIPLRNALEESSTRIGLPDFRFFAVSVSLQYASGGDLTQTLDILSDIVRKRRAMRLKAKASTGEIRMTAYTLGGVPVFTTLALVVSNPGYLVPLWTDPRGHFIIGVAAGLLLLAYLSMRTMMRSVSSV